MNYGVDLTKEMMERSDEDWRFGGLSQPCIASIDLQDRRRYLPLGEVQQGKDDMMDCASRGPINILAAKFTYAFHNNLFRPESKQWLQDKGYVVGGLIDFSDAFVAINSGTTRTGNSLKAPLHAIHKQGLIPKWLLPLNKEMTFDEYHDPARITQGMRDLGKDFAERFLINYEQVDETFFPEALKDDFLNVAAFAWPAPKDGIYPRVDTQPNHVFALFEPRYFAFDNYIDSHDGDYIKHLAPEYSFYDYAYRVYISGEGQQVKSLMEKVIQLLTDLLNRLTQSRLGAILMKYGNVFSRH